jgi:four helix bundle protein
MVNNRKLTKGSKTFQDLIVWQKAHQFVLAIYTATKNFPPDEKFGLTSQIRRASVSIPANIAEGFSKKTKADKARFYNIAKSSLEEVRYYLILSRDLGYTENSNLFTQLEEISRLLHSYTKSLLNSDS